MVRTRLVVLILVGTAALLGCGGGDNAAPNSTATSTPTTTAPADDRPGFEKPPTDVLTLTIQIPDGEFIAGPGDLVVLRADGDLEYLPNALSPNSARPPIRLADYPNPRIEPEEGPGPNFVDDVAGVVNGSVIYGDCCEPVSGNIFAIPSPERGELFGAGFNPELSPDGTELVAANATLLTAFDLATGEGIGIQLNQQPNEPFEMIMDLEWIDDETFMVVILRGDDYGLARYDASTLAIGSGQLDLEGLVSTRRVSPAGRPTGSSASRSTALTCPRCGTTTPTPSPNEPISLRDVPAARLQHRDRRRRPRPDLGGQPHPLPSAVGLLRGKADHR